MVKASVPKGKKAGVYVGRFAVRVSGSFNITTNTETVQGISHKHCTLISRNDGYGCSFKQQGGAIPPTTSASGKLGILAEDDEIELDEKQDVPVVGQPVDSSFIHGLYSVNESMVILLDADQVVKF